MIPTNLYSVSSPMPFDLNNNEDHNHHHPLFNTNIHQPSSSSSLSYSILFNKNQDQEGSCSGEPNHIQSDHLKVDKFVPSSGSWDQEVEKDDNVWKKEDGNDNFEVDDINPVKWMPSKKRIIQRMMKDQRGSERKYDKQKRLVSYEGTNTSSNNNSSNNNTVRVCTDCHTTKTPVWRSGPTGPQSLCNACGIRQRRERRAFVAAATSENGESPEEKPYVKGKKMQIKRKRSKSDQCAPQLKTKGKIGNKCTSFEDLITSLSDNLASYQGFPQDEKDGAILLMALSSGILHG